MRNALRKNLSFFISNLYTQLNFDKIPHYGDERFKKKFKKKVYIFAHREYKVLERRRVDFSRNINKMQISYAVSSG